MNSGNSNNEFAFPSLPSPLGEIFNTYSGFEQESNAKSSENVVEFTTNAIGAAPSRFFGSNISHPVDDYSLSYIVSRGSQYCAGLKQSEEGNSIYSGKRNPTLNSTSPILPVFPAQGNPSAHNTKLIPPMFTGQRNPNPNELHSGRYIRNPNPNEMRGGRNVGGTFQSPDGARNRSSSVYPAPNPNEMHGGRNVGGTFQSLGGAHNKPSSTYPAPNPSEMRGGRNVGGTFQSLGGAHNRSSSTYPAPNPSEMHGGRNVGRTLQSLGGARNRSSSMYPAPNPNEMRSGRNVGGTLQSLGGARNKSSSTYPTPNRNEMRGGHNVGGTLQSLGGARNRSSSMYHAAPNPNEMHGDRNVGGTLQSLGGARNRSSSLYPAISSYEGNLQTFLRASPHPQQKGNTGEFKYPQEPVRGQVMGSGNLHGSSSSQNSLPYYNEELEEVSKEEFWTSFRGKQTVNSDDNKWKSTSWNAQGSRDTQASNIPSVNLNAVENWTQTRNTTGGRHSFQAYENNNFTGNGLQMSNNTGGLQTFQSYGNNNFIGNEMQTSSNTSGLQTFQTYDNNNFIQNGMQSSDNTGGLQTFQAYENNNFIGNGLQTFQGYENNNFIEQSQEMNPNSFPQVYDQSWQNSEFGPNPGFSLGTGNGMEDGMGVEKGNEERPFVISDNEEDLSRIWEAFSPSATIFEDTGDPTNQVIDTGGGQEVGEHSGNPHPESTFPENSQVSAMENPVEGLEF